MILIDASVALKWYLTEAGSGAAVKLTEENLCAPSLILAEVANGLWKAERLKHLEATVVRESVATLPEILSELTPLDLLIASASEIAWHLDHPVYDCIYLADAERRATQLVTADKRLLGRVGGGEFGKLVRSLT